MIRTFTRHCLRCLTLASLLVAADTDTDVLKKSGSLERLIKKSGVYNASRTGRTPGFVIDPAWPQPLPNNWLLGQIGGLYVDEHDHVWVYNRPRTLTTDEAGLEGPVAGAKDAEGQPAFRGPPGRGAISRQHGHDRCASFPRIRLPVCTGGIFVRSGRPFAADHAIPREAFWRGRRTGRGPVTVARPPLGPA